jgi:hypothetical protein
MRDDGQMKTPGLSDSNIMPPSIDLEDKNKGELIYSYFDFISIKHGCNIPYILKVE